MNERYKGMMVAAAMLACSASAIHTVAAAPEPRRRDNRPIERQRMKSPRGQSDSLHKILAAGRNVGGRR